MMLLLLYSNPVFIKGQNFKGYIFPEKHFVLISINNQSKRYTPTEEDIILAEKVLSKKIRQANLKKINQGKDCPQIDINLKRYFRQYVGFIDKDGNRIVWINLLWENYMSEESLKKDIVQVLDGCSYYWNISVNIDKELLQDLSVNGRG